MPEPRAHDRLARRYRWLLATYPRSYRRQRGPEIITTLLDAAPPQRQTPTLDEVRDLLTRGIRFRFTVWGKGAIVFAAWIAFTAAVAGGGLGAYIAWQSAPHLPSNTQALQMLGPAMPAGAKPHDVERLDFLFADSDTPSSWTAAWFNGTTEYTGGEIDFEFTEPDPTVSTADVTRASQQMRLNGWALASADPTSNENGCCPTTVVHRDGWIVTIDASAGNYEVYLTRAAPPAVAPATVTGLIGGATVGWLVAAWALRTRRYVSLSRRTAAMTALTLGLTGLIPATGLSLLALIGSFTAPFNPEEDPAWSGYTFLLARPLAYLGTIALICGLVALARPPHQSNPPPAALAPRS